MNGKKLLTLAGTVGLALAARGAVRPAAADPTTTPVVYEPLLDQAGRPAPGNVVGKGDHPPPPPPDAGKGDSK